MGLHAPNGSIRVTKDVAGNGIYTADGAWRVTTTLPDGNGIYAPDGSFRVVIDTPGTGRYDPTGALRLQTSDANQFLNDGFNVLLLHGDGADASTTFDDASPSNHTVTAVGNVQVDTAQKKFGTGSILFDGTGDFLDLDGSADFTFGTGDFTIDFWIRRTGNNLSQNLYEGRNGANGVFPLIFINFSDNTLRYFVNSASVITGGVLSTTEFSHVALARAGTSTKLFINGVQSGSTYTDSNNYLAAGAARPRIGGAFNGTQPLNGWLDEYRVTKGFARWTANFTPPTSTTSRGNVQNDGALFVTVTNP